MNTKNYELPYIKRNKKGVANLYVNGAPYYILGGELHNSSSSSLEYMEEKVWPYIRDLNMNTVILPIAWESIEPYEDIFDFSLLKGLIEQAGRENMKVVLLWFGLWKNGESFYVPEWVKRDSARFYRAEYREGYRSNTISPLCEEAIERDKNAFCKVMEFLRDNDRNQTVIMVQVENEIGFLGADRDHSKRAQQLFKGTIPNELRRESGAADSWVDVYGEDAAEYFMAYYYAKAVEEIASAGKQIYPIPMYVNAWLEQHPDRPGIYPSGGPVAKLIGFWKQVAPSIDFFSPDIYLPEFADVCESYSANGNPLFIPEARNSPECATNVLYAFGKMNALGFSPFAIEDLLQSRPKGLNVEQLKMLNIEAESFRNSETAPYLAKSYSILESIYHQLVNYRGSDAITGFLRQNANEKGCIISLQNFDIQLDYKNGKTGSGGIILQEKDGFYIIGCNVRFKVLPKKGRDDIIGILKYEDGSFRDRKWCSKRVLNGDELFDMSLGDMPEIRYVKVYSY